MQKPEKSGQSMAMSVSAQDYRQITIHTRTHMYVNVESKKINWQRLLIERFNENCRLGPCN